MHIIFVNIVLGAMACTLLTAFSGYLYHRFVASRRRVEVAIEARQAFLGSLTGHQTELLLKAIESSSSGFVIQREDLLMGIADCNHTSTAMVEGDGYA